jgi:hypothetical protein
MKKRDRILKSIKNKIKKSKDGKEFKCRVR